MMTVLLLWIAISMAGIVVFLTGIGLYVLLVYLVIRISASREQNEPQD